MHVGMYDCIRNENVQRVRLPVVWYTQKNKQTNMHACASVHAHVYTERERMSVTLVTTAAQRCASDLWMCVQECVLVLFH
jgi:hypothetical protein